MKVLYFAHDLDDTAIWRRVTMLRRGGADVVVTGFRRGDGPLPEPVEVLGQTRNGKLAERALTVLRKLPGIARQSLRIAGGVPDVIVARNLEMLLLAQVAASGCARRPVVIYELLDIHRAMLGGGVASRLLRALEARLMRRADEVWISSPGFDEHYLAPFDRPVNRLRLLENKPLAPETAPSVAPPRLTPLEPGRIVIGWFGILRCQWSLATLDRITRARPGRYRVILRGKPAYDALPTFDKVVAANPDLHFEGHYRWPDDLAAIYAGCDLSWLIDRFDAGANSDWLLPNRLYEGGLHGAVPIALATTQVGHRLARLACGIRVVGADPAAVMARLDTLDAEAIADARAAVAALPRATWEAGAAECADLVDDLAARVRGADSPQAYRSDVVDEGARG